ncbi:hypothetical protein D3C73_1157730 [compost metagenome]
MKPLLIEAFTGQQLKQFWARLGRYNLKLAFPAAYAIKGQDLIHLVDILKSDSFYRIKSSPRHRSHIKCGCLSKLLHFRALRVTLALTYRRYSRNHIINL